MLMQVLKSVRTGISFQGRPCLAMCLEDLDIEAGKVRQCVKSSNLGKHNVAKDFLPLSMNIKRGVNCQSRTCTVI